ncbi:hypothetical protein [Pseudonocardia endophytica]|uniref:Uncharacterized protein n=1 Tax=Pseudonocardia endophytica TaxID=401976 RepID=A0A4R1HNM3_PSEEN|nr:hypothetical protein [Pseudonocardia endophytica]TCK21289.1 hypothetical protein EV378_5270 [Pseudonocardia endophytica]
MPVHRDWTRHGVGRALLWWPFLAFVAVAAFPALAVPGMIVTGVFLIVVGVVGGAVRQYRRDRRAHEARQTIAPFAPRRIREAVPAPREARQHARTTAGSDDDTEDDHPSDLRWRAA